MIIGEYSGIGDTISTQGTGSLAIPALDVNAEEYFIPWSKRATLCIRLRTLDEENTEFSNNIGKEVYATYGHRKKRHYSSRSSLNMRTLFSTLRRRKTIAEGTLSSRTSVNSPFTLRRHQSDSATMRKQRKHSSTSVAIRPSVIESGFTQGLAAENYGDAPRALFRWRNAKVRAPKFFEPFFDKLRVENYKIDFPSIVDTDDFEDNMRHGLSKVFHGGLKDKTHKHLFYIRSRLSEYGRSSKFSCDGYFGCGCEESNDEISISWPQWV